MIASTVKGDLLKMFEQGDVDNIVHGCNCFCTMGSGIAKQIADIYPEVPNKDKQSIIGDPSKLGTIVSVPTKNGLIHNMYTQYDFGTDGRKVEYCAIIHCFKELVKYYKNNSFLRIGVPMIGAGLAGGEWNVIYSLINKYSENLTIVIVEYNG